MKLRVWEILLGLIMVVSFACLMLFVRAGATTDVLILLAGPYAIDARSTMSGIELEFCQGPPPGQYFWVHDARSEAGRHWFWTGTPDLQMGAAGGMGELKVILPWWFVAMLLLLAAMPPWIMLRRSFASFSFSEMSSKDQPLHLAAKLDAASLNYATPDRHQGWRWILRIYGWIFSISGALMCGIGGPLLVFEMIGQRREYGLMGLTLCVVGGPLCALPKLLDRRHGGLP